MKTTNYLNEHDSRKYEYLIDMLNRGIISDGELQELNVINQKQREAILKEHPYAIEHGKDGKWRTYLPGCPKRIQVKLSTREAVEQRIVDYYVNQYDLTLEEVYIKAREKAIQKGRKLATIDEYDKVWNKFLISYKSARISQISTKTFKAWFEYWIITLSNESKGNNQQTKKRLSYSQFNKIRNTIYLIFAYCEAESLIEWDYKLW